MHGTALNDGEFRQFQTWLYRIAGINLSPAKKALVAGRLGKRLKHHQLDSYGEYFQLIMGHDAANELQVALDLLTTNETYFFREPKHFAFLREQVLPKVAAGKPLRLWSAACSSGEEPYSLAMTLAESLGNSPWEILASDISSQVLAQARTGHSPRARARVSAAVSRSGRSAISAICSPSTFMISELFSRRIIASRITSGLWQIIQPVRKPCRPSALETEPVVMPNGVRLAMDGGRGPAHSRPA